MQAILYSFSKRSNSTLLPTGSGVTFEVTYKNDVSMVNPTLVLQSSTSLTGYSYLKLDGKYFYIDDIIIGINGLYELRCSLDALATYRSEILGTTAYVNLSSSSYDSHLLDTRFTTNETPVIVTREHKLFSDVIDFNTDFQCCVFSYATTEGVGTTWITEGILTLIMMLLGEDDWTNFLIQFEKQFSGAYDALLGCKKVPFKWYNKGATGRIKLGSFDTGYDGKIAMTEPCAKYSCTVDIPWQYSDFRNQQPYTTLQLYLPGYGYLELNPSDYIGKSKVNVSASVDYYSGDCTYHVDDIAKANTSFGTDMTIGYVSKNSTALVGGAMTLAGGMASGGVGFAVGGVGAVNSIISSQQRSVGTAGGSPSMSNMYADDNVGYVKLVLITHNTNQPPSDVTATQGRLSNNVMSLSGLSGYCRTVGFSLKANCSATVKETINSLMDGGVYLE